MCREDLCRVRQLQQAVVQGVVQPPGEDLGGQLWIGRGQQVGPTDVADEQRVTREHAVGHGVISVLVHDDADRLRCVPRCRHDLQRHVAERDPLTVVEQLGGELQAGARAVRDHRPGALGQLEMAAQEVGMDVRFDDPFDRQAVSVGLIEIDVDVAPGIDDDGPPGCLVADEIGRLGQARQVVLGEDHQPPGAVIRLR